MITIDFETRSEADLKKVGAWAYSEHPSTDIICVCWGIDNEDLQSWWPGKNPTDFMPKDLRDAIAAGHTVEAHNVAFEYSLWTNVLFRKYGWLLPVDRKWRDTMASAAYFAMPTTLDRLAYALKFEGKNAEGARLISKYSKLHLKKAKREIPHEDLMKFVEYCKQDVRIEQSVGDYLGDLPDAEVEVFLLDQVINKRGIYLDLEGIENATAVVEQRSAELEEEFKALTGGIGPTKREQLLVWFAGQGLALENMQAEYLEELLENGEVPAGPARRALQIRLAINKASTKKLDAMARQRGADGRARFQSRYHGASTGRWTGSGFQPLNLNRGFEDVSPDALVEDIACRDPALLDIVYGDAMDAIAKASRHWLMAEPGNVIMSGDFVSIEAVILACLAGEEWKVDAFRRGVKIYEHMADKIYNLPPGTVTKATHPQERQDGKTGELAFGYQGALGAWLKFDSSGRHTDERIIEICKAWRAEHPAIVNFWYDLERAAVQAVRDGGKYGPVWVREISFEMVDEWLSMILPDGKRIWYYDPQIRMKMPKWHKPEANEDGEPNDCARGTCDCKMQPYLTYMAQKEGQWKRVSTYGGKLAENATQATSRQILVPAMQAAEAAGYKIILSVYDEIVVEVPEDFGSVEEFKSIMAIRPAWAADWPISVDAWKGKRYRK